MMRQVNWPIIRGDAHPSHITPKKEGLMSLFSEYIVLLFLESGLQKTYARFLLGVWHFLLQGHVDFISLHIRSM